jgi:hypothetical protein
MTAAQRDYLGRKGIDPWSLAWDNANALGFPEWGGSEAAVLPDGRVLLANGTAFPAPLAPEREEG